MQDKQLISNITDQSEAEACDYLDIHLTMPFSHDPIIQKSYRIVDTSGSIPKMRFLKVSTSLS